MFNRYVSNPVRRARAQASGRSPDADRTARSRSADAIATRRVGGLGLLLLPLHLGVVLVLIRHDAFEEARQLRTQVAKLRAKVHLPLTPRLLSCSWPVHVYLGQRCVIARKMRTVSVLVIESASSSSNRQSSTCLHAYMADTPSAASTRGTCSSGTVSPS